ncbi:GMC oxidoreductase [Polychaeton citri CBS 116435]|uniref:GMC oxidoreductase n=1 Tax=Polychaeton citri CBS 116435 TaxID=1314669 RepID=A0A9P4PZG5_9PEZI|nr:GMC oxidoreductase [Polychaeton citri CBS 116435]
MAPINRCLILLSWLLGCAYGQSVPTPKYRSSYDYIVLGGGTSGLVVANRLSEDPTISVAVVEAGDSVLHNYNVSQIANWFVNLGTSVDWAYAIQPQTATFNRTLTYDQGKALAGTSAINGGTYVRADRPQIDAWEHLGNTGWSWDSLSPYYVKSEHFQVPGPELAAKGAEYEASIHGYNGPLRVGWSNYTIGGDVHELVNQTWQNLGIPYNQDQSTGNLHGFSVFPSTADTRFEVRADAARSYYWPIAERENLDVYVNTVAEKLVWADDGGDDCERHVLTANGVQVRPVRGGEAFQLKADREIIISLGTLKSPVLLEQSGIGNPAILSHHNVSVKLPLLTVGENLQDQTLTQVVASARTNYSGYPPFVTYTTAADLFGKNLTAVTSHVTSSIPAYASAIAAQSNNALSQETVEHQLNIQADLIFNHSTPLGESLAFPSAGAIFTVEWNLLPFSRGSVHMSSTNASSTPLINPNFFMEGIDFDAMSQTALVNLDRKFLQTPPLGLFVDAITAPNSTTVPEDAGVEEWLPYLKSIYSPNSHPIGTCAMMARELGGVVSPELVVYGTKNVRVVDASVLPFQIDGHLTSTLYAVAERASDLIKDRHRHHGDGHGHGHGHEAS